MKQLMLGNAAVARGLYEAGCCYMCRMNCICFNIF